MQILADYHTHTKYSHGKGTIEENVLEAISKGIKTIGISDHGYKHLTYGIKLNDIYKMREEIDKARRKRKREIIKADIKRRQKERAIQRTKGEL